MKKILFISFCLWFIAILYCYTEKSFCNENTFIMLNTPDIKDDSSYTEPIINLPEDDKLPANWRMITDLVNIYKTDNKVNIEGVDTLNISGSGDFSTGEFTKICELLKNKNVTIIDLRRESHGLINNICVSWFKVNNPIDYDKKTDDIIKDEKKLIENLSKENNITVEKLISIDNPEDISTRKTVKIPVKIVSIQTEENLVTQYGYHYYRFGVPDFHRPGDDDVDRFIDFYHTINPGEWLHFHCAAGKGRTTTFMVMYDMMRNYDKVTMEDIVYRQWVAGGMNLLEESKWENDKERTKFIKNFYQYCKACGPDYKIYWSDWIKDKVSKLYFLNN